MKVKVAASTSIGCVRLTNQDAYYKSKDGRILVVADGMGGHLGGDTASFLAVNAIQRNANSGLPDYSSPSALRKWANDAILEANYEIWLQARKKKSLGDMGTTIVLVILADNFTHVAHVGDSRAYRLRNGILSQLTRDHSTVEELIQAGKLNESERNSHPDKDELTRWLPESSLEISHRSLSLVKGDRYLLASDGLTNVVSREFISYRMQHERNPRQVVRRLVKEAKSNGGPDNITVLFAQLI